MFVYINEYSEKQVVDVKLDKYDSWNADWTLSQIIYPVLIQLRDTTNGAPEMEDEDVPPCMKKEDTWTKWDWAIGEMAWAFAQSMDDYLIKDYIALSDFSWEGEDLATQLNNSKIYPSDREWDKYYYERMKNGRMLFAKYFQGLWD